MYVCVYFTTNQEISYILYNLILKQSGEVGMRTLFNRGRDQLFGRSAS